MEVVLCHVEEEEVVEQLQTQRRRHDLADASFDVSSTSSDDEKNAEMMNDGCKSEEEVDNKGRSGKNVYFDKNEGIWKCHHCIWTHKNGHPWVDHVHQKSFTHDSGVASLQWSLSGKNLKAEALDIPEIVNAVLNNQNGGSFKNEILSDLSASTRRSEEGENVGKRVEVRENVRIDLVDDVDEEVIELEFERAVQKVHTHTPYCPNCNSQITKVILRRRKRYSPRPDRPLDLFGCLNCFKIFLPSGIFGSKPEITEGVGGKHTSEASPPVSEGGSSTAEGSRPGDKNGIYCNAFDLFWIFRKPKEEENADDSQGSGQVKPDGESNDEQESLLKPGHRPGFTAPHPSLPGGELAIDIKDETAPGKQEGEIEEGQRDESHKPREPGEGSLGKPTIDQPGKVGAGVAKQPAASNAHDSNSFEFLKCIVYGGLTESITSLSVVSSAAASDATTLNVIVIGLAAVFSGLIVFGNNLMNLQNEASRYQEQLGRPGHFLFHGTFAVLSYLVFGLIPPIAYGVASYEIDNKDYKILAVAAAAFACVFILAIVQAYVRRHQKFIDYVKTTLFYLTMAISVSGVAYAAGDLISILMEKLGWFQPSQAASSFVPERVSATPAWASY